MGGGGALAGGGWVGGGGGPDHGWVGGGGGALTVGLCVCVWEREGALTVGDSLAPAGHDAVAQLDDLGDADDLLGVVALVRQQHQEKEDVGDDGLRVSGGGGGTHTQSE